MMRRPLLFLVAALVIAACSDDAPVTTNAAGQPVRGTITVFAASSLTEAFTQAGAAFEDAYPDTTVEFSFAGSGELVTQIRQGAPADVFAGADDASLGTLVAAGEVVGVATVAARNSMAIITEAGNPKGVTGLADLARADLVVVLCADTVPCGALAGQILDGAGITVTPASLEDKVKGVVTKVTAGEADAGIVFVTDVRAAGDRAQGVDIPADQNRVTNYPMAVTRASKNRAGAQAFIAFIASPEGQAIMAKYGFLAP